MSFSIEVFQNEFLRQDATEVTAVVRVCSAGGHPAATGTDKAILLTLDKSGSMAHPSTKLRSARDGAIAAIPMIPDGTRFGIVAGDHEAHRVYPQAGPLAVADEATRAAAIEAVRQLEAGGGTAMSTWIELLRILTEPCTEPIRLAYLITDGKNESEPVEVLDAALIKAEGVFQCDTRGVGDAYVVSEIRKIASALQGEEDAIRTPEGIPDDFQAFMDRAIGRNIPDVRLRVRTPGSRMLAVRQRHPFDEDLTGKGVSDAHDAATTDYPTGAWAGDECRDYKLHLQVQPWEVGKERLAARVRLVVDGAEVIDEDDRPVERRILAVWTNDARKWTRRNRVEIGYDDQADIQEAIENGHKAWDAGDVQGAEREFGKAVQAANRSGNRERLDELALFVEILDQENGVVRLRHDVQKSKRKESGSRVRKTHQVKRPTVPPPEEEAS